MLVYRCPKCSFLDEYDSEEQAQMYHDLYMVNCDGTVEVED